MDPVPGCHLHLKNPAGDTVYEAETRVLISTELSSFLGFYALCEELLTPPEKKKKKKRCTEENTQGTRKWQLKGTQEAKPLSFICCKPIHGMAWLWHSVFKRWESWDRKEIQSRFENFLAMELFLQMKSPGAPVFKRNGQFQPLSLDSTSFKFSIPA